MKGKITRSMVNSNSRDIVRIELYDIDSVQSVVEIEMGVEEFGYMVSGVARQGCEFNLKCDIEKLGLKREIKSEIIQNVSYNCPQEKFIEELKEMVKPYETDGWKMTNSSFKYNHHDYIYFNREVAGYRVNFERYVPINEGRDIK